MAIKIMLFNAQGLLLSQGDEALMAEYDPQQHLIWVDITSQHSQAFFKQYPYFGIDHLDFEDAQRERHPPQFEEYETHSYLLTHELMDREEYLLLERSQLLLHVNDHFLVTQHIKPSVSVSKVTQRISEHGQLDNADMSQVCFDLMRQIVVDYLAVMLALEERLSDIEDEIFEVSSDDLLAELIGYSSKLQKAKRSFSYLEEILQQLLRDDSHQHIKMDYQQLSYLYNQFERLSSRASLYQGLVDSLINGFISVSAHKTNRVMMTLTLVTAVFLPLTLVAGIYGMNFDNMPELKWRFGYFAVLILMAVIAVSGLWIAKIKRWY
ncbi:magnesium transporter CorA family protein [Shewanella sp. SR43-4]|uniref:magnesium transporter CorA family protein n=1 Tax=Shewanella TaxID=22 RepID=UPI000C491E57|nr:MULTISPECIES: magnesium transporter CorA family protein [Shewanella]NCQ46333.1 magnesium transporter CorA family protein [Shewanella frigidimarina]MBB1317925.1 magnesium transporter CorA family protein [Shewanella sp. SR43-4]NCO72833.1 magnesium transporter CorA family protein [Shewanella vesiculosa]NCP37945.1 magnesium transporter CorA family protein [Shewanella vesiculosa]NCP70257.1 magnesium transporter CorA family protein [Shewanella vesiculosa]